MLLGVFSIGDDFAILGGVLLHVGDLDNDALVFGGFSLWNATLGVGSLVDALGRGLERFFLWLFWRLMMLFCDLDED